MNKPDFTFDDLVRVNGYWPRVFQVIGFREEHYYYPNEKWSDIVYEVYDIATSEWLEAEEEDLTLVVPADKAEDFMRNYIPPDPLDIPLVQPDLSAFADVDLPFDISLISGLGGVEMAKEGPKERPLSHREKSAREAEERKLLRKLHAEVVDDLLDELRDYKALYAEFKDEAYGDRVFAIEAELKKLTEVD